MLAASLASSHVAARPSTTPKISCTAQLTGLHGQRCVVELFNEVPPLVAILLSHQRRQDLPGLLHALASAGVHRLTEGDGLTVKVN